MNFKTIVISMCACVALASCSSSKSQLPYFMDIREISEGTLESEDYTPSIKPDDELLITIIASQPQATAHYNLPLTNPATRDDIELTTTPRQQTYIVDPQGNIIMPVLGKVHVAGLTVFQLRDKLEADIRKDVSDAIVRVELVNFQVVVAGEVAKPTTIPVTRSRFSILDALSAAGDLTPYGERSNVLVIREENDKRVFAHLDLNSSDVLNSPYFYMQQNDYVYVEPNKIRQDNARYNQDNAYKLTVVSTIVSAASVIASLVIALTIK